jgi:hypothetical protein
MPVFREAPAFRRGDHVTFDAKAARDAGKVVQGLPTSKLPT